MEDIFDISDDTPSEGWQEEQYEIEKSDGRFKISPYPPTVKIGQFQSIQDYLTPSTEDDSRTFINALLEVLREKSAENIQDELQVIIDYLSIYIRNGGVIELLYYIPLILLTCKQYVPSLDGEFYDFLIRVVLCGLQTPKCRIKFEACSTVKYLLFKNLINRKHILNKICPVIEEIISDPDVDYFAIQVLAWLAPAIGKEKTEELFLDSFLEICECKSSTSYNNFFHKRVACAKYFPNICIVMGSEITEKRMLKYFVKLSYNKDGAFLCWQNSKFCQIYSTSLAILSLLLSNESRKELVPIYLRLRKKELNKDAMKFLSTFANPPVAAIAKTQDAYLRIVDIHNEHVDEIYDEPNVQTYREYYENMFRESQEQPGSAAVVQPSESDDAEATTSELYSKEPNGFSVLESYFIYKNELVSADLLKTSFVNYATNKKNTLPLSRVSWCDRILRMTLEDANPPVKFNLIEDYNDTCGTGGGGDCNENNSSDLDYSSSDEIVDHGRDSDRYSSLNDNENSLSSRLNALHNNSKSFYLMNKQQQNSSSSSNSEYSETNRPHLWSSLLKERTPTDLPFIIEKAIKNKQTEMSDKNKVLNSNIAQRKNKYNFKINLAKPEQQPPPETPTIEDSPQFISFTPHTTSITTPDIDEHDIDEHCSTLSKTYASWLQDAEYDKTSSSHVDEDDIHVDYDEINSIIMMSRGMDDYGNSKPPNFISTSSISSNSVKNANNDFNKNVINMKLDDENDLDEEFNSHQYWYIAPDIVALDTNLIEECRKNEVNSKIMKVASANQSLSLLSPSKLTSTSFSNNNSIVDNSNASLNSSTFSMCNNAMNTSTGSLGGGNNNSNKGGDSVTNATDDRDRDETAKEMERVKIELALATLKRDLILGPKKFCQNILPAKLLESYVLLKDGENEWTSYLFPSVVITLGRENWNFLCNLMSKLCVNNKPEMIEAMYQVALILGRELTQRDLVPMYIEFFNDDDYYIRLAALKNLPNFLRVIDYDNHAEILVNLEKLIEITRVLNKKWEIREEILLNILKLIKIYQNTAKIECRLYLIGVLFLFLMDNVSSIREIACDAITMQTKGSTDFELKCICEIMLNDFAKHSHWRRRQSFAVLCNKMMADDAIDEAMFAKHFLRPIIDLFEDNVPNVRLIVGKCLSKNVITKSYFNRPQTDEYEKIARTIRKLQADKDSDVREQSSCEVELLYDGAEEDLKNNPYLHEKHNFEVNNTANYYTSYLDTVVDTNCWNGIKNSDELVLSMSDGNSMATITAISTPTTNTEDIVESNKSIGAINEEGITTSTTTAPTEQLSADTGSLVPEESKNTEMNGEITEVINSNSDSTIAATTTAANLDQSEKVEESAK